MVAGRWAAQLFAHGHHNMTDGRTAVHGIRPTVSTTLGCCSARRHKRLPTACGSTARRMAGQHRMVGCRRSAPGLAAAQHDGTNVGRLRAAAQHGHLPAVGRQISCCSALWHDRRPTVCGSTAQRMAARHSTMTARRSAQHLAA